MNCLSCHRRVRLFDPKHPLRVLLPRCRQCGHYVFGLAHKVVLLLLFAVLVYLLLSMFLPSFKPVSGAR